jgi:aspartyl/glutamyl-tRNA(Asn/Gln) amidotransferase C subunit
MEISPEEEKHLGAQLEKILEMVDSLKKVETKDVEPLFHPNPPEALNELLREDDPESPLTAEQVTENAPAKKHHSFEVPKVL